MKKYLALILFGLGVVLSNTAFGVPALNPYSLEICSYILNPDGLDGYKLVNVSGFSGGVSNVDGRECLNGYIFIVPKDTDLKDIKTKEIIKEKVGEEDIFEEHTGRALGWNDDITDRLRIEVIRRNNRFYGTDFKWKLNIEDSKLLYRLKNYCSHADEWNRCHHPNTFHSWIDFYKLSLNEKGEPSLKMVYAIPYSKKLIEGIVDFFLYLVVIGLFVALILAHKNNKKKVGGDENNNTPYIS